MQGQSVPSFLPRRTVLRPGSERRAGRLSLVMMAPWDTMGAYGDQITTSEFTLYFVSDEAGCIVSNILGLEKTNPVSVEMNGIVMVNHMIETFNFRQISYC